MTSSRVRQTRLEIVLVLCQIGILTIPVLFYFQMPVAYVMLITDDQLGEWATFAAYGISTLLFTYCVLGNSGMSRAWLFLLAAFAFFVCMEEISWGQRILGLETPDALLAYNFQGEIGFHNIRAISPDSLTYLVVAATISIYAFAPLLYRGVPMLRRLADWASIPMPSLLFMPTFLAAGFFLAVSDLAKADEIGELFLSLSVLLLAVKSASQTKGRLQLPMPTLSLTALVTVFVSAAILTEAFGRDGALTRRWHTTANQMINKGHSAPALKIMSFLDDRPQYQLSNTALIHARALRAAGDTDAATRKLSAMADRLEESLASDFRVRTGALLVMVYDELGNVSRADDVRQSMLEKIRADVNATSPMDADYAEKLNDLAEVQLANGMYEKAVHTSLIASASTRRASTINKIEWNLGAIAAYCPQLAGEDDALRVPVSRVADLEEPDFATFCEVAIR